MINTVILSLLLALAFLPSSHAGQAMQAHVKIDAAVTDYIARTINFPGGFEVELVPIDAQLQLPECSEALEVFMPTDAIKPGRNSIGVRCNGQNRWSIYTTALVQVFQQVLVLTQPLQRGEILGRQHFDIENRDVTKLHDDFVTQPGQIENKQAARQLPVGTILSSRHFVEPKLVKRGDKVVISASRENFAIKVNGLAMMDGIKGQRIRVKNESSNRVISATVMELGIVSVN